MSKKSLSPANAKVRTWVLVLSSTYLTLQSIAFLATIVLYLFATSMTHRDEITKFILESFYPRHQHRWLRGERAIEVNIIKKYGPHKVHFFVCIQ